MGRQKFGIVEMDPARNPAVLDTGTWDAENVRRVLRAIDSRYWISLDEAALRGVPFPHSARLTAYNGSLCALRGNHFFVAKLEDGQHIFVQTGEDSGEALGGASIVRIQLNEGRWLNVFPTDAATIDRFCRFVCPQKAPKALGGVPRLGIGVRMTTSVWPAVWPVMGRLGFAANAIQNSLRELNLLSDVLAGRAAHENYLFSFGSIEEGHTGSTFEGLWTAGVLEAVKSGVQLRYGADADHIQVKRGPGGLDRAKQVIAAARHYTFYTLDVSDILDYRALSDTSSSAEYLERLLTSPERKSILLYHRESPAVSGVPYHPSEQELGCLIGKHWHALEALEALTLHLKLLKADESFDIELSIDENPPEVHTHDCITREKELIFLLLEAQRRGIALTHIAPNFGVEKGVDYRGPGGLEELGTRVALLHRIASEHGVILDCHSGDDLSRATRRVFGRATNGKIHFKISPMLQTLFADTLCEIQPRDFRRWWGATREYVEGKASAGSAFAAACLKEIAGDHRPSPRDTMFHAYCFAPVGLRDSKGQYLLRELFYTLPHDFYEAYKARVETLLDEIATDLF